jgi:dTDP-4-amino-4,6-dideoxygalactose transaminase
MILMNDFKKEPAALLVSQKAAMDRVIDSGWYILGPQVEQFERQWAEYLNSRYSVGVANGMDAIEISLKALDLPEGSEVITTPMTAFATVLAVLRAGLTPVLADIDPGTGVLDPESVARCFSSKTKVILLVHLYGRATDMDRWTKLAKSKDLILIEDCAQAHGACWNGIHVGSFGIFGAWSFYPTKNLGALGDGGAISTNDETMASKLKIIRNYGQSKRYHHPVIGMNSRLDELQAAILIERLAWLDRFTTRRREIAERYFSEISNPLVKLLDKPKEKSSHVYHLFVVRSARRSDLEAHLTAAGIQTHIHYPIPVHKQESVSTLRKDPEGLPRSEAFANECISLPIHPMLSDDEVSSVIAAVNSFR